MAAPPVLHIAPRVALAALAALVSTSACRRDRAGVPLPASAEPVAVSSARPHADGGSPPGSGAAPPSPFFVVGQNLAFSPMKLANGALVAVAYRDERNYAATLEPDGDVVPIRGFLRAKSGDLIHLTGTWPGELFADFMYEGEWRTRGYQRFAWAITEKGARDVTRSDARFALSAWSNDRFVALTAPWLSALPPELASRTFRLTVVRGGKGAPLPKLPASALNTSSPDDALVAYPNGRVFVTGWDGVAKSEDGSPLRTGRPKVWVYEAAGWTVREPSVDKDDALSLVKGVDETQTLLHGRADDGSRYLARWNGADFVRLERAPRLSAVSIGEDGSVWAVELSGDEKKPVGVLLRASFPDLRFEPVPLPKVASCPALAADGVVARSARDVWVTASCVSGEGSWVLHTSPRSAVLVMPTRAELLAH